MASPQLDAIIQLLRSRHANPDAPIEEVRAVFEQGTAMFPVPADARCRPADAAGVPAEWISMPGVSEQDTIYYLHGGAYALGSIATHRHMIARISAASGARALAIDYRLAPEHPFPAALEDSLAAYRWLLSQGVDPSRLVIAGDSAGGGLTVATLVALRDAGDPLPAAAVLLSPWVDLEGTGESLRTRAELDPMIDPAGIDKTAAAYYGDAGPRHPLVSPIHADLTGLPPTLIHVGTAEVLLDDSVRLAARAKEHGVEATLEPWEEMIHVWQFFAFMLPEGAQAIERIGSYIREKLGAAVAEPA